MKKPLYVLLLVMLVCSSQLSSAACCKGFRPARAYVKPPIELIRQLEVARRELDAIRRREEIARKLGFLTEQGGSSRDPRVDAPKTKKSDPSINIKAPSQKGVSMSRQSLRAMDVHPAPTTRTLPTAVNFTDGAIEFTLNGGLKKNDYETIGQLRDDQGNLYEGSEIKENLNNDSFHDVRENLLEGKILEVFRNSGYSESTLLLKFKQEGHSFELFLLESPVDGGKPIPLSAPPEQGKLYIKATTRML